MRNRSLLGALLITGVLIPITSCVSTPSLTSIVVSPSVMDFGGSGLTTQLTAIGHYYASKPRGRHKGHYHSSRLEKFNE